MEKNKLNEIRRPLEDWTATDVQHPTGPNNMNVPQRERNVPNAANWDIMQNVVGQQGK